MVGKEVDPEGREAHYGAPGESQTENELGIVRHAFREGVCGYEDQTRYAVEETLGWELQQHAQAG